MQFASAYFRNMHKKLALQTYNNVNTQGPSLCLWETMLCLWNVNPFLINFPFDLNFGMCVEFVLHSLPKDSLLSVKDLFYPHLGEFALSYIISVCTYVCVCMCLCLYKFLQFLDNSNLINSDIVDSLQWLWGYDVGLVLNTIWYSTTTFKHKI